MTQIPERPENAAWIELERVVDMCHIDDYDDAQVHRQRFRNWILRGYDDLKLNLLRRVKNVVLHLSVNGAAHLPDDFSDWAAIGYYDSCGRLVPMKQNPQYSDDGPRAACGCGQKALCKCGEYETTEETVVIDDIPYTKTVTSTVTPGGELVREISEPVVIHGENVVVSCHYELTMMFSNGYYDIKALVVGGTTYPLSQAEGNAVYFRLTIQASAPLDPQLLELQGLLNALDLGVFTVSSPAARTVKIQADSALAVESLVYQQVPLACNYELTEPIAFNADLVLKYFELMDTTQIPLDNFALPQDNSQSAAAKPFLAQKAEASDVSLMTSGSPATFNMTMYLYVFGTQKALLRLYFARKVASGFNYTFTSGAGLYRRIRLDSYGINNQALVTVSGGVEFTGDNMDAFVAHINSLGIGTFSGQYVNKVLTLVTIGNPNEFWTMKIVDSGSETYFAAVTQGLPAGKKMFVSGIQLLINNVYQTFPLEVYLDGFNTDGWNSELQAKLDTLPLGVNLWARENMNSLEISGNSPIHISKLYYSIENDSFGYNGYVLNVSRGQTTALEGWPWALGQELNGTELGGELPDHADFQQYGCAPVTGSYTAMAVSSSFTKGDCLTRPKVEMKTRNETLCVIDVRPCGCVADNRDNRDRMQQYASAAAFPCCPEVCSGTSFDILEDNRTIIVQGQVQKIYLKYIADKPCVNGVVYVPRVAAETLAAWALYKRDQRREISEIKKEHSYNHYKRERSKMRKNLMRLRVEDLLAALNIISY